MYTLYRGGDGVEVIVVGDIAVGADRQKWEIERFATVIG
jgi:hypothetical protein